MKQVSNAFTCFMKEAPEQAEVWMEAVKKLDQASALDSKTEEIAYIAVLAAIGLLSGIPFHVKHAKELGVTREEIKSAVLLSLPAVGNKAIAVLPIALEAFDEEK
ncbi:hypothetical protein SCACP_24310 [Sporomusa carbonis]|uniref:carboxymuconolactone decarboxylase family protein n=1 Tax=Sporomusa carbonis TaxID=3076075 RepID=UPI003A736A19